MTDSTRRARPLSSPSQAIASPRPRRWGWTTSAGLVALGVAVIVAPALARPEPPTRTDNTIVMLVRRELERKHISKHAVDDEMSARAFDAFLETLDPLKLYFYQSDIDAFAKDRDKLDDQFRQTKIDFPHEVFAVFLARVEERAATALKWVDAEHDFTVEETMVTDADTATYARTPEEADERWRKRVKFDLMIKLSEAEPELVENVVNPIDPLQNLGWKVGEHVEFPEDSGPKLNEAKDRLRKRYSSLAKRWEQTSSDELLELYVTAMTSSFDPHSSYMSPETLDNFNIQMRLELDGIGASLRSVDGYTEVAEIIAGGAADTEGSLKKGDTIIGVGQDTDGPIEDIVDMKLNDVVKLIRGKRGRVVRLQVKPVENPNQIVEYVITRDRIELKNQEARSAIIETGEKPDGRPYRIGVIDLPSFYMDMDGARAGIPDFKSATRDVRRLLDGFEAERQAGRPIDAVVVDLRFNGGGSLTEAVNLTGLFIDQGPVVQVKGTDGRVTPYSDELPGMKWDGPLVVLSNRFSASASEIFAGAIQDYGRGIVVGDESSHGKGTVQQLFDLGERLLGNSKLGALKLTIQQFYRPGGDSTQNRGVLADVKIPCLTDHLKGITEAEMDFALAFDRVRPLRHDFHGMAGSEIANHLQRQSDERVAASKEFSEDIRRIDKYETQKDRTEISLNLEEFLAERKQLDADKETEEISEELNDSDRPVFDIEDHYNKEAMAITVDYIRTLLASKLAVAR
ncbi:Tail-specific protease precursor [Planctomycetes bacterium K2D]|uniref:Tail-specific protease n=1 Tax=Botrimarina mediterranea TaxID=2528022 RepID=A0A518KB28_9BACT|nr:Tail-specific protease precursor [Botrimarina mediterranea]QDV79649.1 Tail-specific protease precursor [Planctomycetes bacterium K2D]